MALRSFLDMGMRKVTSIPSLLLLRRPPAAVQQRRQLAQLPNDSKIATERTTSLRFEAER